MMTLLAQKKNSLKQSTIMLLVTLRRNKIDFISFIKTRTTMIPTISESTKNSTQSKGHSSEKKTLIIAGRFLVERFLNLTTDNDMYPRYIYACSQRVYSIFYENLATKTQSAFFGFRSSMFVMIECRMFFKWNPLTTTKNTRCRQNLKQLTKNIRKQFSKLQAVDRPRIFQSKKK